MNDKKFRRIMVVSAHEVPPEWRELIESYCDEIALAAFDDENCATQLRQLAACMIIDSRIENHDITGVGIASATAAIAHQPCLMFYDNRVGYDNIPEARAMGITCVMFDEATALSAIEKFLEGARAPAHL